RDYLRGFATEFGLDDRIAFDTLVTEIAPLDATGLAGWRVEFADGTAREYDGVVVANGHYWDARIPVYPGEFTGKQIHSKDYKRPADLAGSRVLVVGAGNSGCDLAVEAAVTWSNACTTFGDALTNSADSLQYTDTQFSGDINKVSFDNKGDLTAGGK
ncbi:NAD(P)-binding domain-containing protein, partial [Gordonia aichiensis]